MGDAPLPTKESVEAYLAKHKLADHFQSALQHVTATQPDDPLAAAAKCALRARDALRTGWVARGLASRPRDEGARR